MFTIHKKEIEWGGRTLTVESGRIARQADGAVLVTYGGTKAEEGSRQFRRSLYVAEDMAEGDVFTEANLRSVRPGFGLPPRHYDVLIGKRVNRALTKGTPVSWDLIA